MKAYVWIGPALILVLWIIASYALDVSPIILPPPESVLRALGDVLIIKGDLWIHIGFTLYRTLVAFSLACVLGIPIGLIMGYTVRVYITLEPVVDFFRSIPPIVLFPLLLLTLGIGEPAKIGVPLYGCTLIIIVNSVYGVRNVPSLRRTVGIVCGLSKWRIWWKIVVPDSLPQVFVGMRTAISLALVLTIVVEMFIGGVTGIGKVIYDYHLFFKSSEMYAAIIISGLIGYSLNKGFQIVERNLIHWADK